MTVDLEMQTITPDGTTLDFGGDDFRKHCLLNRTDDIGLTLEFIEYPHVRGRKDDIRKNVQETNKIRKMSDGKKPPLPV